MLLKENCFYYSPILYIFLFETPKGATRYFSENVQQFGHGITSCYYEFEALEWKRILSKTKQSMSVIDCNDPFLVISKVVPFTKDRIELFHVIAGEKIGWIATDGEMSKEGGIKDLKEKAAKKAA